MQLHDRYLITRRATIVNSSLNFLLAVFKVILGIFGNSHALLADGVHSFSDLITDAIVLFAAKIGTQKPDQEHPYGHRRVETIGTIIIALILSGVAIGIGYDTLHHIISKIATPKPSIIVLVAAGISIITNEFLYHYTQYEGDKINSDLLRSNAWHNRGDALVSLVVFISVIGAILGANYLDAIGALIIAILILKMSIKLIWSSLKELIDTAVDQELIENISKRIVVNPGVHAVHQLRSRSHGENIFLDVHIEVNPHISISEAHYISEQVSLDLSEHFKRVSDVVVHIDCEDDQQFILSKNLPTREVIEKLLKQRWEKIPIALLIQRVILHYLKGKIDIEIYLPFSSIENNTLLKQTIYTDLKNAIADITYINRLTIFYQ